jgi:hypothetical protein
MSIQSVTKRNFYSFSIEPSQSQQVHVSFDQNTEPNERYECTFAAYLEVEGSFFIFVVFNNFLFRMHILV